MVRRLVLLLAFALGVTTGLVSCKGEESAPNDIMVVDTVPPAAVANLAIRVNATSDPSVELSWNPGFEADLAGYRVYRFERSGDTGSTKRGHARIDEMTLVNEAPVARYVDSDVALGETYSYAVTAFDVSGNESPRSLTGEVMVAPNARPTDRRFGPN